MKRTLALWLLFACIDERPPPFERARTELEHLREVLPDARDPAYDAVIQDLAEVDEDEPDYPAAQALLQARRAERSAANAARLPYLARTTSTSTTTKD